MANSAGLRWSAVGLASVFVAAGTAYWVLKDRTVNTGSSSGTGQATKSELVHVDAKEAYVGTQAWRGMSCGQGCKLSPDRPQPVL